MSTRASERKRRGAWAKRGQQHTYVLALQSTSLTHLRISHLHAQACSEPDLQSWSRRWGLPEACWGNLEGQ
eukprot:2108830-Pyramimonas_sp.AAC.1